MGQSNLIVLMSFLFIYGLCIGSFLNVVAYRIPKGMSIVRPASHCQNCKKHVKAVDLIPVFSWLFLRGKCRFCGTSIHWQYPAVEAVTATLWGLMAWRFGLSTELLVGLIFVSFLVPLAVIDIHEMILPNALTYPLIVLLILGRCFAGIEGLWSYLLGGVFGAGSLLLLWWLSPILFGKEGMGLGDVKLIGAIGVAVGVKGAILTLFLGALSGLVVAPFLLRTSNGQAGYMPFGPFLAFGGIVSFFLNDAIWSLFLSLVY